MTDMTDDELTEQTIAAFRAWKADPSVKIEARLNKVMGASWEAFPYPNLEFKDFSYRIKPAPSTRRWSKPEDVPFPWPIVRIVGSDTAYTITAVSTAGISVFGQCTGWYKIGDLIYSTDGRTWHPCEVPV